MDRNMIKSIFSILQVCVLCCLMFLYGSVNASAAVERLSVKGTFLVNEKGEKVVLKGVSMGWHNWWPRFYNASAVKTLKEQWNCTLIRAAMGVEPEGAYLSNPEKALKCVTAVADAAIANDMYVIIDWHSHGLHTEEAKEFFSQITTRYKGVPNVRKIEFDPQKGFMLNGCPVKLKGTNLHQDHAGVGTGIPDRLWEYRIKKMKTIGSNAIRTSHNPMSPVFLDLCDRLGMLVIEENRLMGINREHIGLLEHMIKRDRNHPCIILWSIGNEEWALEGNERGLRITKSMSEYVHQLDSTRLSTQGTAGGRVSLFGVDVKGYNYLRQNPIDEFHQKHPEWYSPVGSEETSGCGTRNVYYTDSLRGWMAPINRTAQDDNHIINPMARGWQFYHDRPWLAGLFYWTGLDYRGEPNPMLYPATGSQFGIFDYCGFPKDEAFYLKSWWTDEPVLHLSPHWNLSGHEGDSINVWAYSNCDEVELFVNGKSLGRKSMPINGYIEWKTIYRPGSLLAKGYKAGKKVMVEKIETTGEAARISIEPYNTTLKADGQDIAIVDLTLKDEKNREVPDAMNEMIVTLTGPATILGYGNGDPGFKEIERPVNGEISFRIKAFSGKAQVIIRSQEGKKGNVQLEVSGTGLKKATQQFIID